MSDQQSIVYDFDVLKPKACTVKINDFVYDLSYIPVGITFDVEDIIKKMSNLDSPKLVANDREEVKKAMAFSIKLVYVLLNYWNPEVDEKFVINNLTPGMVETLVQIIKNALSVSMEGIKKYGKN